MASKQMLAAVVAASMALVFLPTLASSTDHIVGDDHGCTLGTSAFKYASSSHNVAEACNNNKTAATCVWNSGDDRLSLDKPGRRWWSICTVGSHCKLGMKLNVTILPATTPTPLPAPAPAPAPSQAQLSRRALSNW
ncbi:hypothetical protein SORBI_3001G060900 [Sorghum bicolor]|uniref:Phytocyanin domain-containing protein n=1 Tax=Sorghum bicolor TaxID=4558 RepID=C5WY25_SORBI|nr:hypothetical protein SORBI_3001G060900 [Sorghum bicolor]